MKNVLGKLCGENRNTHFVLSNFFFCFENRALYEICGKILRAVKAADDNMAHAHCMLDT
jgi:hypothetical protein